MARFWVALAVVFAVVGPVATSAAAAKPKPKPVTACDLLTLEEITAALPALPVPMGPTPGDAATAARIGSTYSSCTWGQVGTLTLAQARVFVGVELKAPKSEREIVRIKSGGGYGLLSGAEAKGLGTLAGLSTNNALGGNEIVIDIVKGKALMTIESGYTPTAGGVPAPVPDRAAVLELARKAVARLPGAKG